MNRRIRLLIADDSETMRAAIAGLLAEYPEIEVVGQASNGEEAVAMAASLWPDVITMDVQMPRLSGLEAIARIMTESPTRILVVGTVSERQAVDLSFRAVAAGALEMIAKPQPGVERPRDWGKKLVEAVRLMAEVPVVTRGGRSRQGAASWASPATRVDAVGLVASTGGPPVLAQILSALPAGLPVPLLVAQHIAPGFAGGLLRWFSEVSALEVVLARDGQACEPGHVYLPPDGMHLEVSGSGTLKTTPSTGGHCPSGDRLFSSMAARYGQRCAGVLLSGMGDDGAKGLLDIFRAGGVTLGQSEASCVVFGMPQAAGKLGAVSRFVSAEEIGPAIWELSGPVSTPLPTTP